MKTFTYTITDREGIHARPAGLLVKEAGKYKSQIMIEKAGKKVDLKRIFALMSLAAKKDDQVTVTCEGVDEEEAATALETFFKENL